MLIFDQLKRDDPHLRVVALMVLGGLAALLAGLWWVQIVSARDYQENLQTQSFRTVRIPSVRGKILDRDGKVLAENRPTYNISLYLDELRKQFDSAYSNNVVHARRNLQLQAAQREKELHRGLNREERKQFILTAKARNHLREQARCEVAASVVEQVGQRLQLSLTLDAASFEQHYEKRLVLPFPILTNATPTQIARFAEQFSGPMGVDLEIQSTRVYPLETTAAHVLGSLRRDDSSAEGEEADFSYRLPDYRGVLGVEYGYDKELRGMAGAKSVLVNNFGYRQTENVWSQAEPGHNLKLTLDVYIQQKAEAALETAAISYPPPVRGAVVVMDVNTGNILALASSPTINPNDPIRGYPRGEWQRRHDPVMRPEINRATQENYQPGSVFKTVVAMAALDAGLDPDECITVEPNPAKPTAGLFHVGRQAFRDTAPPGDDYNFRKALKLSSNSYFIHYGLWTGAERIVALGHRLHFGEYTGLQTRQDKPGTFPSFERLKSNWRDGDTANMCIGQGEVDITPVQVAVLTSAIANGGHVLWPRLVDRIETADPTVNEAPTIFPSQVRDELNVKESTLRTLKEAMLADVEDADGSGRRAATPGLRICGKTGTADKRNARGELEEEITWFSSFAPYDQPRYAVVVMVEGGASGGRTCAPVAGKIYQAILEREQMGAARAATLAQNH